MLIIAIPKSASTSLMTTLGRLYDLRFKQEFFSKEPVPSGFNVVWKYHSDMRQISQNQINKFNSKKAIFKQHILPTDEHLNMLKYYDKVVLLREPKDVILSYRRAKLKGLDFNPVEFMDCNTEEDWLERAREIGLYEDLDKFYKKWLNAPGKKIIIFYDELISEPTNVINKIAGYWFLPKQNGCIKLDKRRYARD